MMKAIVVFESKTGFTEKYARWIAEELGADIFPRSAITTEGLANYDAVIYGGGLYAVGINGVEFIKDNLDRLTGKKVAVFACGCTPYREETVDEVRDMNFSQEQQGQLRFFYMRGGFDYKRLGVMDKILMSLLKLKILLKRKRTKDEKGMLAVYSRPADFTQKDNIVELVSFIRS